jgi:hypothetical protein
MNVCKHCGRTITRDWASDVIVMKGSTAETTEGWEDHEGWIWCSGGARHSPLVLSTQDVISGLEQIRADLG